MDSLVNRMKKSRYPRRRQARGCILFEGSPKPILPILNRRCSPTPIAVIPTAASRCPIAASHLGYQLASVFVTARYGYGSTIRRQKHTASRTRSSRSNRASTAFLRGLATYFPPSLRCVRSATMAPARSCQPGEHVRRSRTVRRIPSMPMRTAACAGAKTALLDTS